MWHLAGFVTLYGQWRSAHSHVHIGVQHADFPRIMSTTQQSSLHFLTHDHQLQQLLSSSPLPVLLDLCGKKPRNQCVSVSKEENTKRKKKTSLNCLDLVLFVYFKEPFKRLGLFVRRHLYFMFNLCLQSFCQSDSQSVWWKFSATTIFYCGDGVLSMIRCGYNIQFYQPFFFLNINAYA